MNIAVLVKYVPDAGGTRTFTEPDITVDRESDGLLSELDEFAVEQALRVCEKSGGEVVAVTMGPEDAESALRKALQMGAHRAVHITDEALHGSDVFATASVLARAVARLGDIDLVLTGMASTDAGMGVVPALVAEHLGLPHVGSVAAFDAEGDRVRARREFDTVSEQVEAPLPAVLGVTDQSGEPRSPSFRDIVAAKKKAVDTWTLADLGIEPDAVGLGAAWSRVVSAERQAPRSRGQVVRDDGAGATALAEFLISQRLL